MSLRVYSSLSRQKEVFAPLRPPNVTIYICGPTVYGLLHVGNFRGPVFYNLVRNWLERSGYKVKMALNFTDIDDRIITKAAQENVEAAVISERYIQAYKDDFATLGLRPHDLNPKVTDALPDILKMTGELIEKETAYVTGGDVMYSIQKFPEYGKLSGRKPEELQAGSRVQIDEKKQSPLDFALWKAAKAGEPAWPSPWGPGRPGWHIECSAMIQQHFGEQIDIHGGGTDLIFPHHENEIAQSEGVTGKTFSKYWMHVGMLNLSGEKMSKSLGNIVPLREFVKQYNAEIYKWVILSSHYRSLAEFGDESTHRGIASLARIYSALAMAMDFLKTGSGAPDPAFAQVTAGAWKKFSDSLDDDFNTPEAFAAIFEVVRVFNSQVKRGLKPSPAILGKAQALVEFIRKAGEPMALFQENPAEFLTTLDNMLLGKMNLKREEIDTLVRARSEARAAKDFAKSDELRAQLAAKGISVMDLATESFWEVTK